MGKWRPEPGASPAPGAAGRGLRRRGDHPYRSRDRVGRGYGLCAADPRRAPADVVARFGGDEFVLLFPETTTAGAQRVLRRLGTMKASVSEEVSAELKLTIAWGVATWPTDGPSPEQLLRTADRHLYEMKKRRQNGKRVRAPRVAKRQIA